MPYATHTLAQLIALHWAIRITCPACNRFGLWGAEKLATLPADATVSDVARRLKCEGCRATDLHWIVVQDTAAASEANMARFEAEERRKR